MSTGIDVTTHGPDGHWDYADIARLCAYRDRLRALNAELLAAVKKTVSECAECSGTGRFCFVRPDDGPHDEPCEACADLRALIARARGEP